MEITKWQDIIIDTVETKEKEDYQDERIKEDDWLEGIESQIENVGQVCLGY